MIGVRLRSGALIVFSVLMTERLAFAAGVTVACIDAAGTAQSVDPTQFCKASLPDCSEIMLGANSKPGLVQSVKDMLSLKIYGFYQSVDVDLKKSTSCSNLVANVNTKFTQPICSVVGHTLKHASVGTRINPSYDASLDASLEVSRELVGKGLLCGTPPGITVTGNGQSLSLNFDGGNGSQWSSYMMGAYPWIIRKHAAQILNSIHADLGNIGDVLGDLSGIDLPFLNQLAAMQAIEASFGAIEKTICSADDTKNKCTDGVFTVSDPAQRVCALQKSRFVSNTGALPYLTVLRIMKDAQAEYDQVFGTLLSGQGAGATILNQFEDECGSYFPFVEGLKLSKLACTATCLIGGTFHSDLTTVAAGPAPNIQTLSCNARFYSILPSSTYGIAADASGGIDSYTVNTPTNTLNTSELFAPLYTDVKNNLQSEATTNHPVYDPQVATVTASQSRLAAYAIIGGNVNDQATLNSGFAGVVEKIIRNTICGQTKITDMSDCDTVNIPTRPVGCP